MADLLGEDDNTYTVKGPQGRPVKIPKTTAQQLGFKPNAPAQAPPKPDPDGFVNYARSYPTQLNALFSNETTRLQQDPAVGQWFQTHLPNANPQQRMTMIQQQAAKNAQTLATQDFQQQKQKYGIKEFTPDSLKQMLAAANAKVRPDDSPSAGGPVTSNVPQQDARALAGSAYDATLADIKNKETDTEFGKLHPYMPYDAPQQPQLPTSQPQPQPTPQPVVRPPVVQRAPTVNQNPGMTFTGAPPPQQQIAGGGQSVDAGITPVGANA